MLNPRYTGRQVWNKQRRREVLIDVHDVALGHETKVQWNPKDAWVFSNEIVNPPIIDDDTYNTAQQLIAARGRGPTIRKPHPARRPYVLRGILHCGICHRRMQGNWINNAAYYRCRYPDEYAAANQIPRPRNVYLREDLVLPALDHWLSRYFAPHRRAATITAITAAHQQPAEDHMTQTARETITACNHKLARYRAALEALDNDTDADAALIAGWITEAQQHKTAAEAQLRQTRRHPHISRQQITDLINTLGDHAQALTTADPACKTDLYHKLGLQLTYQPATQTVRAEGRAKTPYIGRKSVTEAGLKPFPQNPSRYPTHCR